MHTINGKNNLLELLIIPGLETGPKHKRKTNAIDVINWSIMLFGKYTINNCFAHNYMVIGFF